MGYIQSTWNGSTLVVTGNPATSSSIVSLTPTANFVAPVGTTTLSLSYYGNSDDVSGLGESYKIEWMYQRQPTGVPHFLIDLTEITYDSLVSTSTTVYLSEGNYFVEATLKKCVLFGVFCFTQDTRANYFVVGSGTTAGNAFQGALSYIDPFVPDVTATSTFNRLLDIPYLLKTKIPFSYAYGVYELFKTFPTATSSSVGSIVVDFSGTTTPSYLQATFSDITLFSTSTVSSYLSPTLISLIKALITATIWAGVGMHLYSMATRETMKDVR